MCGKDVLSYRTTLQCKIWKTYFIIIQMHLKSLRNRACCTLCVRIKVCFYVRNQSICSTQYKYRKVQKYRNMRLSTVLLGVSIAVKRHLSHSNSFLCVFILHSGYNLPFIFPSHSFSLILSAYPTISSSSIPIQERAGLL